MTKNTDKKLFATIGYTEDQLDRREQILEAKRRREELRFKTSQLNQYAWAWAPN